MLLAEQHWSPRSNHHGFSKYLQTPGTWVDPKHSHATFCLPPRVHVFWATLTALFNSWPTKETATAPLISVGSGLGPFRIRQVMGRHFNPPLPKENVSSPDGRFLILLDLIGHFHAKGQLSLINKFIIWCPGWHVLFVLSQARSTASSAAV